MSLEPAAVLRLIEDSTRTVRGALQGGARLADLPGWDSLGMVQFMAAVTDAGGRRLQVAELRAPATVAELVEVVTRDPAG
ncbi:MAG TPA: hypothetical protein VK824_00455 [Planctomycetota bacterium]|nr:hypothetical protein [Planctomycetota bacterium]